MTATKSTKTPSEWTLELKLRLILWGSVALAATLAGSLVGYIKGGPLECLTGGLIAYAGSGALAGIMFGSGSKGGTSK